MKILRPAVCGTLESSDIMITVAPNDGLGIEIQLESVVKTIFGDAIEETVREVLAEFGVEEAAVSMVDQGALDCVIRARMEAVILRASGEVYDWSKEDGQWESC